jgi:hypothetical protein
LFEDGLASLADNIGAYNLGVRDSASWDDEDEDDQESVDDSVPGSPTVSIDDLQIRSEQKGMEKWKHKRRGKSCSVQPTMYVSSPPKTIRIIDLIPRCIAKFTFFFFDYVISPKYYSH